MTFSRPSKFILLAGAFFGIVLVVTIAGTLAFIIGVDSLLLWRDLRRPVEHRILFIGNSFTYQNDLDKMVGAMLDAQQEQNNDVFIARIAFGGYRLFDHLDDTFENERDSNIRAYLIDGPDQVRNWDMVIFQEQVPLQGSIAYPSEKANSVASAIALGKFAHHSGSNIMFMQTWGYALDPNDPENVYPEFSRMQAHLANANFDLSQALLEEDIVADIAPAGHGFLLVYQDVMKSGLNPFEEGSKFLKLYAEDRQHASQAGTYLAAAVVTASYLDTPVSEIDWVPIGLEPDFCRYLREVADRVVFGSQFP
ncbi:MAG: DUF4886 domain-containing protein [Chloroflexota bacterium]